jgi:hypothetical protein
LLSDFPPFGRAFLTSFYGTDRTKLPRKARQSGGSSTSFYGNARTKFLNNCPGARN